MPANHPFSSDMIHNRDYNHRTHFSRLPLPDKMRTEFSKHNRLYHGAVWHFTRSLSAEEQRNFPLARETHLSHILHNAPHSAAGACFFYNTEGDHIRTEFSPNHWCCEPAISSSSIYQNEILVRTNTPIACPFWHTADKFNSRICGFSGSLSELSEHVKRDDTQHGRRRNNSLMAQGGDEFLLVYYLKVSPQAPVTGAEKMIDLTIDRVSSHAFRDMLKLESTQVDGYRRFCGDVRVHANLSNFYTSRERRMDRNSYPNPPLCQPSTRGLAVRARGSFSRLYHGPYTPRDRRARGAAALGLAV